MNVTRRMFAQLGAAAAVCGLAGVLAASPAQYQKPSDEQVVKVGEAVPAFTLTDLNGKEHNSADWKGKVVVIEWTNPDCPYIKGVYEKGVVKATQAKLKEFGDDYVYVSINSTAANTTQDDVIKKNASFMKEHKLDHPVLIDFDGKVGKMFGARHTPDIYVIDKEGVLRYFGAFTDDSSFSKGDKATNYAINAVEQVRNGETVTPTTAKRWGCGVKYASK